MKTNMINHAEYSKKVRDLSLAQLRYIIKDCQEAMKAMPDNPKNGYYADEINYCTSEIYRRSIVERCMVYESVLKVLPAFKKPTW